jgi:hypothetical protein
MIANGAQRAHSSNLLSNKHINSWEKAEVLAGSSIWAFLKGTAQLLHHHLVDSLFISPYLHLLQNPGLIQS